VENLWAELVEGETRIQNDPPLRLVQIVSVIIRDGKLILVEAGQEFGENQYRYRGMPPTEKIKPGESQVEAAIRCLQEEMEVSPNRVKILSWMAEPEEELQESPSYPGLTTKYIRYKVEAKVDGLPRQPFSTVEAAHDDGDPVKNHQWLWQSKVNFFTQKTEKTPASNEQVMDEFKLRVKQFLATHTTLTLATLAADGHPQAAPLFYAEMDDLSLIFVSEQKVRHSQNVARDNRVAVTIYADGQQWQTIRGLQLEGTCTAVSGEAAEAARAAYLTKYPFIAADPLLAGMLQRITFYKISPTWLRLIDNSQGFGHKEEWRELP
jgi:uncharacterized protein YhbP (UPF0306 family)/ADP-ribose pyrophosphatase YjhB (NUDIX family)